MASAVGPVLAALVLTALLAAVLKPALANTPLW